MNNGKIGMYLVSGQTRNGVGHQPMLRSDCLLITAFQPQGWEGGEGSSLRFRHRLDEKPTFRISTVTIVVLRRSRRL